MYTVFERAGLNSPEWQTLEIRGLDIHMLRLDKIHPYISGNKIYKLGLNILEAERLNKPILTFGGAYSNHILATACLCQKLNIECKGIIRGDELRYKWQENTTLKLADQWGMQLEFVDRTSYRAYTQEQVDIAGYDQWYVIPEGGKNRLGIKGCASIMDKSTTVYDAVFVACGTGGTAEGIVLSQKAKAVYGVDVLKGVDRPNNIGVDFTTQYHFGGYGKYQSELVQFIEKVWHEVQLPLDPIYTVKSFKAMLDFQQNNPDKKTLWIHSGGIQANRGFNLKYGSRLPEIQVYD